MANPFLEAYSGALDAGAQEVKLQREAAMRRAQLSAGNALAGGDYQGASNALAMGGDLQGATQLTGYGQGQDERKARITGATAYSKGDMPGAVNALAQTGDLQSIGAVQNENRQRQQEKAAWISSEAHRIRAAISQIQDPTQRASTAVSMFDAMVPQHVAMTGATEQDIADMRAHLGRDPDGTLNALTDPAKIEFHTAGDTLFGTNTETGNVISRNEGSKYVVVPAGAIAYPISGAGPTGGGMPQPPRQGSGAPGGPSPDVVRTIIAEAGGEGPEGWKAVMGVIAHRAAQTGQPMDAVVSAPGQFEGHGNPKYANLGPGDPLYDKVAATVAGVGPSQYSNFYSPTAQAALGRPKPAWDDGTGVDIGRHRFFANGPQSAQPGTATRSTNGYPVPAPPAAPGGLAPNGMPILRGNTGHPATPQEIAAVGLPAGTAAWTGADGKVDPYPATLGTAAGTIGKAQEGKTGDELLATLPKAQADMVKALKEGRMQFPGSFAISKPYWQNMLQLVSQYDPSFDAVNYNARAATRKDFTAGKSAQTITSLNTVIGHLNTLDQAVDKLDNGGIPMINGAVNWLQTNTGDPRVTNFNVAREAAVAELTRAFRGSSGSEKDLEEARKTLNAANSPAQLHQAVRQMVDLLHSRVQAIGDQYSQGMGTTSDGVSLLHPKAQAALQRLQLPRPQSDDEVRALPPGTHFLDRTGREMVRKGSPAQSRPQTQAQGQKPAPWQRIWN